MPCLQLKNNLRVNKISLFLFFIQACFFVQNTWEKFSQNSLHNVIIVRKCYLIKSYWYFISIHYFEVQNINCCLCWWHCSYFRFWKAWICNAKNNLNLSKLKEFWANKRYSLAPVPLGIGLGLSSSLFHILRSLFIQQVCGSVEIQGAAVQITDGYLSAKLLQVAKFARGMGEPLMGTLSYQTNFRSVWILRFWFFWSTRIRKF